MVWQLPASCRGQPSVEVALAATLLRCHASAWRRLEMQVLEGAFAELPPTLGPAGLPPRRVQLDLEQLMQVGWRRRRRMVKGSAKRWM